MNDYYNTPAHQRAFAVMDRVKALAQRLPWGREDWQRERDPSPIHLYPPESYDPLPGAPFSKRILDWREMLVELSTVSPHDEDISGALDDVNEWLGERQ